MRCRRARTGSRARAHPAIISRRACLPKAPTRLMKHALEQPRILHAKRVLFSDVWAPAHGRRLLDL